LAPIPKVVLLHSLTSSAVEISEIRMESRLGGLRIDDQLESRELFDRQIGGICAFQYLVDVTNGLVEIIGAGRSVFGWITATLPRARKIGVG
jgi:hypothetical protein